MIILRRVYVMAVLSLLFVFRVTTYCGVFALQSTNLDPGKYTVFLVDYEGEAFTNAVTFTVFKDKENLDLPDNCDELFDDEEDDKTVVMTAIMVARENLVTEWMDQRMALSGATVIRVTAMEGVILIFGGI